jgi:hypothetical protein
VNQVLNTQLTNVHQMILRELDRLENDAMPDCKLSTNTLDYGTVEYQQSISHDIILENVGNVAAKVRFIPKLEEKTVCRDWMWINPPMSIVMPGKY